ncbi:outer membrane protein assembly factor BamD [Daejeonella oryzae]|uniref:outer membrane protein assembly factor BamD n=1 Tax=Daejeonella oryzae TaxID=1122943 RepID=UPI0004061007|nr:outer membrane protein assembly factor BamD [Daejeonella oryzae]
MFKNKRLLAVSISLLLIVSIAGCKSNFEKIRASTDIAKKYQEAVILYNKKSYSKALILFDDLVQRYRGRTEAEDLYYYYAYTNYNLKDYTTARYHFKTFSDTYPNSPKAEECRYMAAYCYYLESPIYSLDQENTIKAIESLQLFINLYPKSERVAEASKLIDNLRSKLETKSYANAKLFLDIGDYRSAVIAFRNSMRDFPDTKYAEEMEFLTIKAQYLYAKNSIEYKQEERYNEAIALYNEFSENYPSSKYLKEAQSLKKDSDKSIVEVRKLLATSLPKVKEQEVKEEEIKNSPNE